MSIDPQEFARLLGAEIVGEVPDVGGGPFGMARLAHVMRERLTPSRGERPGRPTNPNWEVRPKVPMSEATARKLAEIAEAMSTSGRKVSPMQVAAQLLEEAVARMEAEARSASPELGQGRDAPALSEGGRAKPSRKIRVAGEEVEAGQNATTEPRGNAAKIESSPKPKLPMPPGKPAGRRKKA